MKKLKSIILGAMLCLTTSITFAQKDSVFIEKSVDEMSDKVYFFPSRQIVCVSEDKKTAFGVSLFLNKDKNNSGGCSASDLKVKMINIGACVEKNQIIFLFEDDTKISLVCWNEFNCKGDAWFALSKSEMESLATKKIKKIKVQNGRSFESYTHELKEDSDYFIQLFYAINNNKIKLIK
jgi:hypothetical protein